MTHGYMLGLGAETAVANSYVSYPASEDPIYPKSQDAATNRAAFFRYMDDLGVALNAVYALKPRLVWGTQLADAARALVNASTLANPSGTPPAAAYDSLNKANHLYHAFWTVRRRNMVLIGLGLFGLLGYGAYSLVRRK